MFRGTLRYRQHFYDTLRGSASIWWKTRMKRVPSCCLVEWLRGRLKNKQLIVCGSFVIVVWILLTRMNEHQIHIIILVFGCCRGCSCWILVERSSVAKRGVCHFIDFSHRGCNSKLKSVDFEVFMRKFSYWKEHKDRRGWDDPTRISRKEQLWSISTNRTIIISQFFYVNKWRSEFNEKEEENKVCCWYFN